MSIEQIQAVIKTVDASMSMEEMPLTHADKARIADCLCGKTTFTKAISEIVDQYKRQYA